MKQRTADKSSHAAYLMDCSCVDMSNLPTHSSKLTHETAIATCERFKVEICARLWLYRRLPSTAVESCLGVSSGLLVWLLRRRRSHSSCGCGGDFSRRWAFPSSFLRYRVVVILLPLQSQATVGQISGTLSATNAKEQEHGSIAAETAQGQVPSWDRSR